MADAFSSVWLKIERAKKHVHDLESEILAFWNTKPYEVETQRNPKTGTGSYRIKGTPQPLPESIALITGDAAHNIRSALDHFACGAVPTVMPSTAFPVWRTDRVPAAADWSGLVKGKLNGASPRLIRAVTALKAYKTGDGENIWAVDELDRIDKHRLLITVAGANTAIVFDAGELFRELFENFPARFGGSMPLALKPTWTPVEEGAELFGNVPNPSGFKTDLKFTFDVAFGEPEILKSEPVVPALRLLADEVEGLLKRLIPLV